MSGCSAFPGGETEEADATPTRQKVIVEVVGDDVKEADITYVLGDESPKDERGAELPWRETLTAKDLAGVSVVAKNTGDAGTLTCTITVNGKVREKVSAEGEFALVVCDPPDVPARA